MSLYVGASSGERRLSSERSATHRSMSISACSEKSGIVAFDSAIRRAIVCWVRVSSTTVVSPLALATRSAMSAVREPGTPVACGVVPDAGDSLARPRRRP